jgi:hypothetical protein
MALDYSTLSDAELEAIANNDYSKLSEATLNLMAQEDQPREKSMGEKAATALGGVGGMAVDAAQAGYNAIPYKELLMPYAGYKAIPHVVEGAKSAGRAINTLVNPSAPVAPGPNPAMSPSYAAPSAQPAQPSMIERGTQYAKEMQRIAAEKVMQGARAAAPAAQAAAGAARAIAPAALGLGAMMFPSSTGPAVPQSGPMRGMEINPNTGRPWTPEELAQLR